MLREGDMGKGFGDRKLGVTQRNANHFTPARVSADCVVAVASQAPINSGVCCVKV